MSGFSAGSVHFPNVKQTAARKPDESLFGKKLSQSFSK
jgi:hypothetical protein